MNRPTSYAPRILALAAAASLTLACGRSDATGPDGGVTVGDVGLAVGEAATFAADGNILALEFPSASDGREYRLAVQSADAGTPDQIVPMRLTREGGSSGSGSVSGSRRAAGSGADSDPAAGIPPWARDLEIRHRIQEDARRRLARRGVRPARPSGGGGSGGQVRASLLPDGEPPQEGDTLQFWFAAQEDLSTPCSTEDADTVTAAVEHVGERAALVQDTAAPEGGTLGDGFTDSDFQEISDAFDADVVPTDSAYFGSPTDIDSNERVYILFTPKVNELDPDDGDTQIGGFFVPNDLADSGDPTKDGSTDRTCPASNEAELLYLRAPDPEGTYGNPTSADRARRNAFSVSSHELQHLLNAANRVIKGDGGFGDLETAWLSEALSHLAEEVVGLAALGAEVRSNLTYDETRGSDSETFDTYLRNDFYNAGQFMAYSDTARGLTTSDPGGVPSLRMRGFGWLFVRWLADHHGAAGGGVPGSGEEALIRDLAQADGGELTTGVANVEEATGAGFGGLLADFGIMVAADDDVEAAGGEQVLPTWHLRDMYAGLADDVSQFRNTLGTYPLRPVERGFAPGTDDFEVRPGAGKHFVLSSDGSTPELRLELTDLAGSALDAGVRARIVVIRVR